MAAAPAALKATEEATDKGGGGAGAQDGAPVHGNISGPPGKPGSPQEADGGSAEARATLLVLLLETGEMKMRYRNIEWRNPEPGTILSSGGTFEIRLIPSGPDHNVGFLLKCHATGRTMREVCVLGAKQDAEFWAYELFELGLIAPGHKP